jgi:hypothetical protein
MFLKSHLKKLKTKEKPMGQNVKILSTISEGSKNRYANKLSLTRLGFIRTIKLHPSNI